MLLRIWPPKMGQELKKIFYPWPKFLNDFYNILLPQLLPQRDSFTGIYAPPRGGLVLGVMMSHNLDLPYLINPPEDKRVLIADDIADTGKTLESFRQNPYIVTLFYHRKSTVMPWLWLREKHDHEWIIFPWENAKRAEEEFQKFTQERQKFLT